MRIFSNQGLNPRFLSLLHRQAGSLPLALLIYIIAKVIMYRQNSWSFISWSLLPLMEFWFSPYWSGMVLLNFVPSVVLDLLVSGFCCCSVIKSCLTLRPHGLQHTSLPYPLPSPGIFPNSCSQGCPPAISSSDAIFSCLWSFWASRTFPMGCLFTSDEQNTRALASVLPWIFRVDFP